MLKFYDLRIFNLILLLIQDFLYYLTQLFQFDLNK